MKKGNKRVETKKEKVKNENRRAEEKKMENDEKSMNGR